MVEKLPVSIKNLFPSAFPDELWHDYATEDGKDVHLLTRRDNNGKCQWGLYVNDSSGSRVEIVKSGICQNVDDADVEWFIFRIRPK